MVSFVKIYKQNVPTGLFPSSNEVKSPGRDELSIEKAYQNK